MNVMLANLYRFTLLSTVFLCFTLCSGCGASSSSSAPTSQDLMQGIVTAQPPDTPETLAAKKEKLNANLSKAKEQIAQGKLDEAIAGLEEAVGFDPKHREVLMLLVQASQRRSKELVEEDAWKSYRLIVQAGGYLRTLQELHPESSADEKRMFAEVLFDEACSHARSKRQDEFRGSFGAALAAGFADAERIKNEPSLQPMWEVAELKEMRDQALKSMESHQ